MSPEPLSTFHYHACAHAFSGRFTRPFDHQIDVQAATSLPVIGGHGNARVENFQFREFVSFRKGYTHVSGADQEERVAGDGKERVTVTHNTLVTAVIEGVNILDILTADRIVARLYSKHRAGHAESVFSLVGSRFENLRIADCKVDVDLDLGLFETIPTFEAALNEFDKKGDFHKIASNPFGEKDPIKKPKLNEAFLCSCVKDIRTTCPGVKPIGRHGFHVPGFGKVFLGELLISHGERTLTMVRLEIGSAVSGSGTLSQASGNGQPYPPSG